MINLSINSAMGAYTMQTKSISIVLDRALEQVEVLVSRCHSAISVLFMLKVLIYFVSITCACISSKHQFVWKINEAIHASKVVILYYRAMVINGFFVFTPSFPPCSFYLLGAPGNCLAAWQ